MNREELKGGTWQILTLEIEWVNDPQNASIETLLTDVTQRPSFIMIPEAHLPPQARNFAQVIAKFVCKIVVLRSAFQTTLPNNVCQSLYLFTQLISSQG